MKKLAFLKFASVAAIAAVISMFFLAGCAEDPGNEDVNGNPSSGSNGGTSSGGGNPPNGGGGNNTRDKAISVTVGNSSSHTINSSGEHWFKFVGTGDPVIFETTGNVVDTYIDTYDGDDTWSWDNDDNSGDGSNALVSRNTTSGTTYYIKITSKSGTSGSYTFVVTAPAFNIRTNPISVTVGYSSSHTISSNGTHWFKFIGDGNRVFFETEGNVVNTEIKIYIGDNTSYSYDWYEGVNFITVSGTTYYISITPRYTNGTYTFNVHYGTGDGSSRYNAKEVTKGYSSSNTISYGGENWFIYQGTGEPVTFKTTGDAVDTYIDTYDGDDTWSWDNDDNSGDGSNALVNRNTTSGTTYYIKITPRSGTSGTYTFIVE